MKALGVQNTRTPFPGSLDLIQCKDGEDKDSFHRWYESQSHYKMVGKADMEERSE